MKYIILNKDNYSFFIDGYLECVKELNSAGVELSTKEDIKEIINTLPSNIFVLVGIEDGEVICTASLIMERKLRYKQVCCHIEDVAVRADKRGMGYGKQIVSCCIETAKNYNCYKVKLSCSQHLVSFYSSLGISEIQMHMSSSINMANKLAN